MRCFVMIGFPASFAIIDHCIVVVYRLVARLTSMYPSYSQVFDGLAYMEVSA